jgi:hypothetical protein
MRNRGRLKRRMMKNNLIGLANIELQIEYKRNRNFVVSLIRKTKRNFIKNKIENSGNDSQSLWETLSTVVPTKKSVRKIKTYNEINGNSINADDFNEHFIYEPKKIIEENIGTSDDNLIQEIHESFTEKEFHIPIKED